MINKDSIVLFSGLVQSIQNELRKYGQYFAMRNASPGEQRFGTPDILTLSTALLGWSILHYMKSFISEIAKENANKLFNTKKDFQDLEDRVNILEEKLKNSPSDINEITNLNITITQDILISNIPYQMDEHQILQKLIEYGLTTRQAKKAAADISRIINSQLI
jgi:hypothetical protein